MDKVYKIIRVLTVAPVLALIMAGLVAGSCEGVPFPMAFGIQHVFPWSIAVIGISAGMEQIQ